MRSPRAKRKSAKDRTLGEQHLRTGPQRRIQWEGWIQRNQGSRKRTRRRWCCRAKGRGFQESVIINPTGDLGG